MDERILLFFPLISEGKLNNSHGSTLWPSFLLALILAIFCWFLLHLVPELLAQ